MIVLKLQGGLGNQMFEYAFGRAVQEVCQRRLVLDTSDFRFDKKRDYALGNFRLSDKIELDDTGKYNWIYDQRTNYLIKVMIKCCPQALAKSIEPLGIYIWDIVDYREMDVDSSKKRIYLHGYWQSEKYFAGIADKIKAELKVRMPQPRGSEALLRQIQSENAVCVHIRRKDFLLSSTGMCNCTNQYYLDGIHYIAARVPAPVFYVFSDDIEDVKRNFDFGGETVHYVEGGHRDYEDMRLMYSCKHFVLANSTFSWWASYLSDSLERITIAPKKWYSVPFNTDSLVMPDWVLIKNV